MAHKNINQQESTNLKSQEYHDSMGNSEDGDQIIFDAEMSIIEKSSNGSFFDPSVSLRPSVRDLESREQRVAKEEDYKNGSHSSFFGNSILQNAFIQQNSSHEDSQNLNEEFQLPKQIVENQMEDIQLKEQSIQGMGSQFQISSFQSLEKVLNSSALSHAKRARTHHFSASFSIKSNSLSKVRVTEKTLIFMESKPRIPNSPQRNLSVSHSENIHSSMLDLGEDKRDKL